MRLIFLAGPMTTSGEPGPNTHHAIREAARLRREGFACICPQSSFFEDAIEPLPQLIWMEEDRELIRRSDGVLQLPGESAGAEAEVAFARDRGKPVFESVLEVLYYDWDAATPQDRGSKPKESAPCRFSI